ncbi:hypothetical protein NDU88_002935 [Pleurodeles waltl]|uniref:Secreted protein n=1 Tax=Pleurodeles waltl TaxID=8319 RepID=A0AAV7LDW7_PLEWA|nr:hypothetical protein NDU88_002935 [Pleurodeles waltl]
MTRPLLVKHLFLCLVQNHTFRGQQANTEGGTQFLEMAPLEGRRRSMRPRDPCPVAPAIDNVLALMTEVIIFPACHARRKLKTKDLARAGCPTHSRRFSSNRFLTLEVSLGVVSVTQGPFDTGGVM